jgi:hypothetical protein
MKAELLETATILQHFVSPIEYGDMTGLTDHEEAQVNRWLGAYPNATFEWGDESEFARCDITGLMGNCVEVKVYLFKTSNR